MTNVHPDTVVHPSARVVASAVIGPGTVVEPGAVVSSEARLENVRVPAGAIVPPRVVLQDGDRVFNLTDLIGDPRRFPVTAIYFSRQNEVRVWAGCRENWTLMESFAHWGGPRYPNPTLGARYVAALQCVGRVVLGADPVSDPLEAAVERISRATKTAETPPPPAEAETPFETPPVSKFIYNFTTLDEAALTVSSLALNLERVQSRVDDLDQRLDDVEEFEERLDDLDENVEDFQNRLNRASSALEG